MQHQNKNKNGLSLMLQKNRGVYLNAKILNLDDSNLEQTVKSSYILLVRTGVEFFTVTVVELHS